MVKVVDSGVISSVTLYYRDQESGQINTGGESFAANNVLVMKDSDKLAMQQICNEDRHLFDLYQSSPTGATMPKWYQRGFVVEIFLPYLGVCWVLSYQIAFSENMKIWATIIGGCILLGTVIVQGIWEKRLLQAKVDQFKVDLETILHRYSPSLSVDDVTLTYGIDGEVYIASESEMVQT